jgi:hypothetical protein
MARKSEEEKSELKKVAYNANSLEVKNLGRK